LLSQDALGFQGIQCMGFH